VGQFVGVYDSAAGYFTANAMAAVSTESTTDVDALYFTYAISDSSYTTATEGLIVLKRCHYIRLINLNKLVARQPSINRTYMERFFASKLTPLTVTEVSAGSSSSEAEALVGLIYPLLLKRSPDHQGLVDYTHKLTRGLLTPLELMQELMASGEYQQAQGGYDYLADGGVGGYFNAEVLALSAEFKGLRGGLAGRI